MCFCTTRLIPYWSLCGIQGWASWFAGQIPDLTEFLCVCHKPTYALCHKPTCACVTSSICHFWIPHFNAAKHCAQKCSHTRLARTIQTPPPHPRPVGPAAFLIATIHGGYSYRIGDDEVDHKKSFDRVWILPGPPPSTRERCGPLYIASRAQGGTRCVHHTRCVRKPAHAEGHAHVAQSCRRGSCASDTRGVTSSPA